MERYHHTGQVREEIMSRGFNTLVNRTLGRRADRCRAAADLLLSHRELGE